MAAFRCTSQYTICVRFHRTARSNTDWSTRHWVSVLLSPIMVLRTSFKTSELSASSTRKSMVTYTLQSHELEGRGKNQTSNTYRLRSRLLIGWFGFPLPVVHTIFVTRRSGWGDDLVWCDLQAVKNIGLMHLVTDGFLLLTYYTAYVGQLWRFSINKEPTY